MMELFKELKNTLETFIQGNHFIVGIIVGLTCYKISKSLVLPLVKNPLRYYLQQKHDPKDPGYDKQKFYLHICPRSCTKQVPNLSPFAVKVETWLRMKKIQYEVIT